ncbi:MAG: type I-D CRISPR-associated protein Cas10d/Csc3 [Caldilineaceae bacterium]|nr:type I-D CRISPR-associated protein Cas10d/Csc3 [Caldilineaceae bacterium]
MAFDLKNILLKFAGPPDDVLGDYITHIANGGLTRYRRIVQWGNKDGQPLYAHVIDLVFTFARLADFLELDEIEQRVMMLALSAHDINKVVEGDRKKLRFADLASHEIVAEELEQLGADEFFPAWRTYLPDIVALIRAHSDHFHHSGELLLARTVQAQSYTLGGRVRQLTHLIKGLDALDLSHTLEERQHKATFLSHLNAFSDAQYELVHHAIGEQRGILTNVIHNRVAEYMARHKDAQPLLYYPDGVVYLVRRGTTLTIDAEDLTQIGGRVAEFLEGLTRGSFESFIKAGNQGIKVDEKCLELGIPFRQLWQRVDAIVQGKNYATIADMEQKARKRAGDKIAGDDSPAAQAVRQRLAGAQLLSPARNTLRLGELVRSYYIFLGKHFKKQFKDPWSLLYQLLEVPEAAQPAYAYFDPNYDRAYIVAADLTLSYDEVLTRILAHGEELLGAQEVESPWTEMFAGYVQQQLRFSFQLPTQAGFAAHIRHYVANNHKQSAYGSSALPADLWRAGDVAKTIKVQQFSNRLAAGPGDPVKNVDPITKAQFLLEKLNYPPGYDVTTYYLHIYPYAFYTDAYLQMWRATVRELAERDVSALFLKTDDILRSIFDRTRAIVLSASGVKSNGLPLPGAGEVFGNLLIWPLNAPGSNETESFWYAFTCAFAMQRFVGGRVVLTRSAVPILGAGEVQGIDLYTDEIPVAINGLLRQNGYGYEDLAQLQDQLAAIYAIQKQVGGTSDELMPLLRSLNDGPLGIYFSSERLLLKRIKNDKKAKSPEWLLIRTTQMLSDAVRLIVKTQGGERMDQVIRRLAQLAWEGNLKGQSLEKNSLMMPLDHCFEKLQQWQEPMDKESVRAVAAMDIYAYLERIRDKGMVGRETQVKANAFVDVFFDELLGATYKENRSRLLTDEKFIRSAFLFHIREQVAKASDARKERVAAETAQG